MKTKTLTKKLNFSKATIAHLGGRELAYVKGGSGDTCPLPCIPSLEYTDCCTDNCPTECTSFRECSC